MNNWQMNTKQNWQKKNKTQRRISFIKNQQKKHSCRWWTLCVLYIAHIHADQCFTAATGPFPPISPMGFHRLFRLRINEEDNDDREEEKLLAIIAFITYFISQCVCVRGFMIKQQQREREDKWGRVTGGGKWVELRVLWTGNSQGQAPCVIDESLFGRRKKKKQK